MTFEDWITLVKLIIFYTIVGVVFTVGGAIVLAILAIVSTAQILGGGV